MIDRPPGFPQQCIGLKTDVVFSRLQLCMGEMIL